MQSFSNKSAFKLNYCIKWAKAININADLFGSNSNKGIFVPHRDEQKPENTSKNLKLCCTEVDSHSLLTAIHR